MKTIYFFTASGACNSAACFSSQPDFAAQLTRHLVSYGLWECDSQLLDRPQLVLLQPTAADWLHWLQQLSQAFDCPALVGQALPTPLKPADIRLSEWLDAHTHFRGVHLILAFYRPLTRFFHALYNFSGLLLHRE